MRDLTEDDRFDEKADQIIQSCLKIGSPRSFFLYAGAGSGKTRSLISALRYLKEKEGPFLSLHRKKIAVITYTNAACDEIKQRLEYDALIDVQTIHSFAWSLIQGFNDDIREWVKENLESEIADLEDKQARGRASKASSDRARAIEGKRKRHKLLTDIREFIYSPTGDNRTNDSLNHSEVISMTADFLTGKHILQRILVSQYPVLLIDESQDTNARLMDAFFCVQKDNPSEFCLGLFGDTMQRIYNDGKTNLASSIPQGWEKPEKMMNHRCPTRIITLINKIRAEVDGVQQRARTDKPKGVARLFILKEGTADRFAAESIVSSRMAEVSGDDDWMVSDKVKTLTLEHQMAASRFGFEKLFESLYPMERLRTSFLDGSLSGLRFFTQAVLPLVRSIEAQDSFRTMAIVREKSPLLDILRMKNTSKDQTIHLAEAENAVKSLSNLCIRQPEITLLEILQNLNETNLFEIPESLAPFAQRSSNAAEASLPENDIEESAISESQSWRKALGSSLAEIEAYSQYVTGTSKFDTHQGVKGREFPRVMVVISDEEARGFLFKYDKLFGVEKKSETDLKNETLGSDTTIDRTRRLFYVTCSRAEQSLAIVYYSNASEVIRTSVLERNWFQEDEIEVL